MTPLVLIVGFLGAGKTTFLKQLLPQLRASGIRPRVVINDYQNARVDAEQMRGLADDVRAIAGDCVCCGSREELVEALTGRPPLPDEIVLVETNGTTDSESLIEMLSLDPALGAYAAPLQVSLIDVKRWQKRLWHNPLEREQARTATHVVLSRTDTESPQRVAEVEASFEKFHVHGERMTVQALAADLVALAAELGPLRMRSVSELHEDDHGTHDHGHDHGHGHHHFASFELPLPASVDRAGFENFLKALPDEVLRAKGIVRVAGEGMSIFQKVDRFDEAQFFPLGADAAERAPLILFIGPRLDEAALRASAGALRGTRCEPESCVTKL